MASSVWRGRITFGLVTLPVRLVKAARRERAKFRRVQKTGGAENAGMEDDEESSDDSSLPFPSRVLKFPSDGKNNLPLQVAHAAAGAPAEVPEGVVRVRNEIVSATTSEPVKPAEVFKGYEIAKDQYVVLSPEELAALRPKTSTEMQISEFVKNEEIESVYYETSYYVEPEAGGEKTLLRDCCSPR